jgi:hypothetical protein
MPQKGKSNYSYQQAEEDKVKFLKSHSIFI